MAIDPTFTFSANSLQDYQDCPRRFELKYLLKQSWPAATSEPVLEFERHVQRGSQLHQLVHQYIHGIPQDVLMATITDSDLAGWFDNFLTYYAGLDFSEVFPEQSVRIRLVGFQVIAIFDLLAISSSTKIHIFDWKTSQKKKKKKKDIEKNKRIKLKEILSERIQTKLYPLAAYECVPNFIQNFCISHENIDLTYFFVSRRNNNIFHFEYDKNQYLENKAFLESLITEIKDKAPGSFALTEDDHKCEYCVYRSLCERGIAAGNFEEQEAEIDIEQLLENMDYEAQDEIAF